MRSSVELRQRAEAACREDERQLAADLAALSPDAVRKMLHDLRVHQIELEMQNEELRASQLALDIGRERYFDLYDLAPVGYCTVSTGGLIEQANLAAASLLGVTRDALAGRPLSRFIVSDDADLFYRQRQQLLAGGGMSAVELRLLSDGGAPIWVRLEATAVAQADGTPELRVMLIDINESKLFEEERRKSGALQRAIFNSVNFSSIATDARGIIQIFNVGAQRMLGYTADEVIDTLTPADLCDPQEVIARAALLSAELERPLAPGFDALVFKAARGIEDIYELSFMRKDGRRLPVQVSVTALRDEQEQIIGYLLIGTDNTARNRAKQLQEESEERLAFALQMSHTGAWDLNLDDLSVLHSLELARIFGHDAVRDDWNYDSFMAHVLADDRGEVDRTFREALLTASTWSIDCRIRRADGEVRWILIGGEPRRDENGKIRRLAGIVRDITVRKQVDVERLAFEQTLLDKNVELERATLLAQKANLAKTEFLSSMSHELRTPLTAILGFAQLMESAAVPPTPSQKKSIDQILKAGWYLLELINEILDLAVIESGKSTLSIEPVSLADVFGECQAMIEPQAQKRGIAVSFAPLTEPLLVNADRIRVKQVLINLVSNAIKYNRAGGTVAVEAVAGAAGSVRIVVRDSGAGLSADQLAQLFQPFNRLGRESGAEEGTGIGLVVCKRLVEWMGGVIGVDSTPGTGSAFWFELTPVAPALAASGRGATAQAATPSPDAARLRTLLYVEDNPANLLLVEEILVQRADIRLFSACDGAGGIERARALLPDIILMDLNLPGISGREALEILAQDPATAGIPVLALSANARPDDIEAGLRAGFFRYITKPIVVKAFMTTIDEALAARK